MEAHETTFAELVHGHFLPRYDSPDVATMTRRNVRSHTGDGTRLPARKGAKNERGARFALLSWTGTHRLNEIGPSMISTCQDAMVTEGYEHSSILAKRGAGVSLAAFPLPVTCRHGRARAGERVPGPDAVPRAAACSDLATRRALARFRR